MEPLQIERHEWVDSTNTLALARARAGAPEGTVIVAAGQRAGRGRLARMWESPYGKNLYASVVLRPALVPAASQPLTLVAGIALAEAIEAVAPSVRIGIKWPNDLMIAGRKLGGILTEASITGGVLEYVVVGFGINVESVAGDFSPALRPTVTSLMMATGKLVDCEVVLTRSLAALARCYDEFVAGGFEPLRPLYDARAVALQKGGDSDITPGS